MHVNKNIKMDISANDKNYAMYMQRTAETRMKC
jgi:hypothetical protein